MRSFCSWIGACALTLAIGACGSSEERKFADPNLDNGFVAFNWPSDEQPLPKSSLRIEGPLVAFVDTTTSKGAPATFKVFDGANDVTATAKFGVRDTRNGAFSGPVFTPAMGSTDPIALTTLVGAKVGDRFVYAHLVIVQQARTGNALDATVIAPHNAASDPTRSVLKVGGGINRIDIALMMDTTGTMLDSIKDIKDNLQTKIVPDLKKGIPDLAIGLAEHRDYPVGKYGDDGDFVVFFHHTMTVDIPTVQNTLGKLGIGSGDDLPEGQMPAMFHMLTGAELKWSGGSIAARTPPSGRLGAIGFRPGALPVVVLITDDIWHEEPAPNPYDPAIVFTHVTMTQLADAFTKLNARFVDVSIAGKETQADQLSDLTNSNIPPAAFGTTCGAGKCCTGVNGVARDPSGPDGKCRLNFLHNDGVGVSSSLTQAIKSLSIGSIFDVTAKATKGTDFADGSALVQSVTPLAAGDTKLGCPAHAVEGAGYKQVPADKAVCFELGLANNTTLPPKTKPQIATARLDVSGNPGNVLLDRRTIVFVVPPSP